MRRGTKGKKEKISLGTVHLLLEVASEEKVWGGEGKVWLEGKVRRREGKERKKIRYLHAWNDGRPGSWQLTLHVVGAMVNRVGNIEWGEGRRGKKRWLFGGNQTIRIIVTDFWPECRSDRIFFYFFLFFIFFSFLLCAGWDAEYTYIHTYIHTHTYIRTYVHTYIRRSRYVQDYILLACLPSSM